jgi:hypothetical protein
MNAPGFFAISSRPSELWERNERAMKNISNSQFVFFATLILALAACASTAPVSKSPPTTQPDSPQYWRTLTQSLHGEQIVSADSFAVIVPRDDIDLESEMGQIPISAGIASKFYFFRCPCGKVKLLGEFIICDYEADDVLDALRAGKFSVISLAPILQNTRPNVESIRFQAEGEGPDLVKPLRGALDRIARHDLTTNPDE